MSNITLLSDKKKQEKKIRMDVTFKDGEEKTYFCDFMGQSSEYPPLMIILEKTKDDDSFPIAVLNSDDIKHIEIKEIEEEEVEKNE